MNVKAQICCTNVNKKLSSHTTCTTRDKCGIAYQHNWAREVYIFITSQYIFQKTCPSKPVCIKFKMDRDLIMKIKLASKFLSPC